MRVAPRPAPPGRRPGIHNARALPCRGVPAGPDFHQQRHNQRNDKDTQGEGVAFSSRRFLRRLPDSEHLSGADWAYTLSGRAPILHRDRLWVAHGRHFTQYASKTLLQSCSSKAAGRKSARFPRTRGGSPHKRYRMGVLRVPPGGLVCATYAKNAVRGKVRPCHDVCSAAISFPRLAWR